MSYLTETVVDKPVDQGGFADLGVPDQDDRAEVEVELGPGEARVVLVEDVQPLLATATARLLPMESHILSDCFSQLGVVSLEDQVWSLTQIYSVCYSHSCIIKSVFSLFGTQSVFAYVGLDDALRPNAT